MSEALERVIKDQQYRIDELSHNLDFLRNAFKRKCDEIDELLSLLCRSRNDNSDDEEYKLITEINEALKKHEWCKYCNKVKHECAFCD